MLHYVVEQTLLGNADQLKERTIGVEAFDRDPSYDPSTDPIVRFTASEVRKRLAQYYVERVHAGELQIDLPLGSYVAVFRPREESQVAVQPRSFPEAVDPTQPSIPQIESGAGLNELSKQPTVTQAAVAEAVVTQQGRALTPAMAALTAVLAGVAGLCIGLFLHRPVNPTSKPMDQFWSTVTTPSGIVTFCVGVPAVPINDSAVLHAAQPDNNDPSFWNDSSHFAVSDVVALTHLTSALDSRGKAYRIIAASKANYFELREGPVVLIGAFDNPWTMRLMQNLRYTLVQRPGSGVGIIDTHNPQQAHWDLTFNTPADKLSHDYGVVARFHDSTTGQPVVLVAGLAAAGTQAAGELLSNPAYFAEMVKNAPQNWSGMNMEVVLETQVIDDHAGPPKIVASAYW